MPKNITGPSLIPTAQNPAKNFKQVVKVIPNAIKTATLPGISNPDVQAGTLGNHPTHDKTND